MTLLQEVRLHPTLNPLWWRIPAWAAITTVSVVQTHGTGLRIATGLLLGIGAIVLQFIQAEDVRIARFSVSVTTVTGLAACFTAHAGLAEILVVVAASRVPHSLDGLALRWFVILDTIAFTLTVGYISHSYPGLLAGLGIPLLVQRSVEQRDLTRERDLAQALLAEVQRGRESEAQAAALQERGRIAREMHDVLAHSLAGLSVHLQAIRALAAREGVSRTVLDPLDRAADLARDGLSEARAAVSTLRDPIGLGVGELPALVERHPGNARLVVTATPGLVSPEAGHAVYRAIQESLTNAARYAPGSAVTVTLAWSAAELGVRVEDPGPAPGRTAVRGQGTGLGLAGMDDRISHVGGTLQAGPAPGGGWRVELRVPASTVDGADVPGAEPSAAQAGVDSGSELGR